MHDSIEAVPRKLRPSPPALWSTILAVSAVLLAAATPAAASAIAITSVEGFPNGRTLNDLPPNAIDGDITTYTWTTNPNNVAAPSHLAIGFASTPVNRLRLWKLRYGGGGQNIKDLTIQYTNDDNGIPLSSRSWITVTGLTNGFGGGEFLNATSVNPDGTVTGDIHDSETGDGWASLAFNAVTATGLRISFVNPNPSFPNCDGLHGDEPCNHYRVGEFEAHIGAAPVPALGTTGLVVVLVSIVTAGALALVRRRGMPTLHV